MDDRPAKGVGLGRGTKDEKTQMTIRKKKGVAEIENAKSKYEKHSY